MVKLPISLNVAACNVRGCSINLKNKGEISQMFLRRKLDVCGVSKTKLKRKGGCVL